MHTPIALENLKASECGNGDVSLTSKKKLADTYYHMENRTEDAIHIYTGILADYPEDLETLIALGSACVDLKRPDEAQVFFRKVLDVDPLNEVARGNLDKLGEYGSTLGKPSVNSGKRLPAQDSSKIHDRKFLVSAIVSTYNAGQFIRGCLEDLESQNIADRFEIIVIDSCSEDCSSQLAK